MEISGSSGASSLSEAHAFLVAVSLRTPTPCTIKLTPHHTELQAQQRSVSPTPPEAKGLLQGAPEHDWSRTRDKYFYNNNVWVYVNPKSSTPATYLLDHMTVRGVSMFL
jgi:hypothetical protein